MRSKSARPRADSIRQLVLSPKKKKKKTWHVLNIVYSFIYKLNRKVTICAIIKDFLTMCAITEGFLTICAIYRLFCK